MTRPSLSRRALLRSAASLPFVLHPWPAAGQVVALPARGTGELDIHHISTGRGNSTLLVMPDGRTLLIDAGSSASSLTTSTPPLPNNSRRPGEWIARYCMRHTGASKLDALLVTHLHPDHFGDITPECPPAPDGDYRLTGVSDVDAMMPISLVLDRSFPDYEETPPLRLPSVDNYLAWLQTRQRNSRSVQAVSVGTEKQFLAQHVKVRMLAANGVVWTGEGEGKRALLPKRSSLPPEDRPAENVFSAAIRLQYGRFSYFAGGDLCNDTQDGRLPWMDVETPVVRAAGRTEVASADHHGYFDACGPEFVKQLDAQAYVIQAWDVGHPGPAQAQRMLGDWTGKARHDVYATGSMPANRLINSRFTPLFKSLGGHVVIRVASGGESYRIFVTDAGDEADRILFSSPIYHCRA